MTTAPVEARMKGMGVLHAIAVGAAVLGFLFILFWASDALGFVPPAHRFVSIFSGAEAPPVTALVEGLPVAIGVGGVGGALLATFSNAFQFLNRA